MEELWYSGWNRQVFGNQCPTQEAPLRAPSPNPTNGCRWNYPGVKIQQIFPFSAWILWAGLYSGADSFAPRRYYQLTYNSAPPHPGPLCTVLIGRW